MITIDQNRCTGCGDCVNVYPFGAISDIQDQKLNTPSNTQENNRHHFNPFSSGMGSPGNRRVQGQGQGRGRKGKR